MVKMPRVPANVPATDGSDAPAPTAVDGAPAPSPAAPTPAAPDAEPLAGQGVGSAVGGAPAPSAEPLAGQGVGSAVSALRSKAASAPGPPAGQGAATPKTPQYKARPPSRPPPPHMIKAPQTPPELSGQPLVVAAGPKVHPFPPLPPAPQPETPPDCMPSNTGLIWKPFFKTKNKKQFVMCVQLSLCVFAARISILEGRLPRLCKGRVPWNILAQGSLCQARVRQRLNMCEH